MKQEYKPENSYLIFHANIIFLVVAAWWVYGIFTTFLNGQIPIFGWSNDHNVILGFLWTLILGQGAVVPAKAFHKICGIVAFWRRGYLYLPIFLLNLLVQLYFWIIVITIWFPQPLLRPFDKITGGFLTGLIALALMIPICLAGNIAAFRVLRSFTEKEPI